MSSPGMTLSWASSSTGLYLVSSLYLASRHLEPMTYARLTLEDAPAQRTPLRANSSPGMMLSWVSLSTELVLI